LKKGPILFIAIGIAGATLSAVSAASAADLIAAQKNYQTFCVKCHGVNGKGDGPAAATLVKKPRNYTDCALMEKEADDKLFNVIKNGGAANGLSPDMQAWKDPFEDN